MPEHLNPVTKSKLRKVLIIYRSTGHNLALEMGGHTQTLLPKKSEVEVETELH